MMAGTSTDTTSLCGLSILDLPRLLNSCRPIWVVRVRMRCICPTPHLPPSRVNIRRSLR